jgi:hypothetical protein
VKRHLELELLSISSRLRPSESADAGGVLCCSSVAPAAGSHWRLPCALQSVYLTQHGKGG